MKKYVQIIAVFYLLLNAVCLQAQSWETFGVEGFSNGSRNQSLVLDSNNIPYVAFNDFANTSKMTVMKFDGVNWVLVGNAGFSASFASYPSLILDSNNIPYVAYRDSENIGKTTVMKFNGSSWVNVGVAGFSSASSVFQSMAIDNNNIPYVVFVTNNNGSYVSVRKFNGTNWENVGVDRFYNNQIAYTNLAFDSNNIPYVVYNDRSNSNKTTVIKFNGTNWENVGNSGFSVSETSFQKLALDSNNTPYVAFKDQTNSNKTTVMKFDGSNWVIVGNAGFSDGIADDLSLAIDNNNIPYLAFRDAANSSKTTVMKFDGVNWVTLGNAGFSVGLAYYQSLAISSYNKIYVAYTDYGNSGKTTVKVYNNKSTANNLDFSGILIEGEQLTGIYDYTDTDNDLENGTTYQWFRSDNNAGLNKIAIVGATNQNYTLTATDVGKFISFQVTPKDGVSFGTALESVLKGPIQAINILPIATNVTFTGNLTESNQLNGTYTYADANNDLEVGSTYQWFRSDNNAGLNKTAIVGATNQTYTLTANDVGKFISFQVTPKDSISFGIAVESSLQGAVQVFVFQPISIGSWQIVGFEGFSPGVSNFQSLTIDVNNVPYVAFRDDANSYKTTVMKFDGSNWVFVGNPGFSSGIANYQSLKFDNNNVPYVAFQDHGNSGKATVMKFNGTNWVTIGNAGFSVGYTTFQSLAFDNNNFPYVAYRDDADSGKTTVMKFDGSTWVNVGNSGFSSDSSSFQSLVINSNNVPYVAFRDDANSYKTTVMKFDGTNWINVGNAGFSEGFSTYQSLALDINNKLYVTYRDGGSSNKTMVKKFDGVNWVLVGSDGFSSGGGRQQRLAIDRNNVPYVAYQDILNLSKTIVKGFDGVNWLTIGSYLASTGVTNHQSLAINSHNKPYVAFSDDGLTTKTTVQVFNSNPTATNITFSGTLTENQQLSATYKYTDANNDLENGTTYQWFRSDNNAGLNKTPIVAATNQNYTLTATDVNKFISFQVTPKDGTSFGTAVESSLQGAVQAVVVPPVIGASWETVGVEGFTVAGAAFQSLALNSNNVPYVAFVDGNSGTRTSVMKFDGTNWVFVGNNGFSAGISYYQSLVIDSNDVLYVAYRDGGNSNKTTVMKFDGSNWVTVGNAGFSAGASSYQSLAIDSNNVPYVAFSDASSSNKTTVMKFDGVNWVNEGMAGFSAGNSSHQSLAIDSNNKPFVSYSDGGNSDKTTVMKFDGSNWVNVGNAGFSAGRTFSGSLKLDSNNVPYISFLELNISFKTIVMKFDGSNWVHVGSSGGLSGQAYYQSLIIDSNNVPYLAYDDFDNSQKTTVKKFDGVNWVSVGNVASSGRSYNQSLAIDGNNKLYVAFRDEDTLGKATVKIYNNSPTTTNVTFTGTLTDGQQLLATYNYADANNDLEVGSTYQWFRSDNNAGLNKTAIVGATNQTYTLTATEVGKFISFRVTPKDGTSFGTAVESALQGPISQAVTVFDALQDTGTVLQNSIYNVFNVLANDSFGILGPNATHPLTFTNGSKSSASVQGGLIIIYDNNTPNNLLDDVVLYTPKKDFNGTDSFNYVITDANGNAKTATVTITVTPIVAVYVPVAFDDITTVLINSTNNIINVLANDNFGLDGAINGGLTMTNGTRISASVQGGSINIDNKNTPNTLDDVFIYTPKAGFSGTDSFQYTITDASGDASTATVTVTVNALTDVPIAINDLVSVTENSINNSINVLLNDSFGSDGLSSLTLIGAFSSQGGTLSINNNATINTATDDTIVYTPATNYVGTDSFQYTITDSNGDASNATVTITIIAAVVINTTPIAQADVAVVNQNSTNNSIQVLLNDNFGANGPSATHPLTFANGSTSSASTNGGLISVGNNGTPNNLADDVILYSPKKDFNGTDSFNYVITDANGDASTATVTITVNVSSQVYVPTAVSDTATVNANSTNNIINVLANDTAGLDGYINNGLTMTNGTLTSGSDQGGFIRIENQGTNTTLDDVFLYSPKPGFSGIDTFRYTITDANGDASTTTVTVTVTAPINNSGPLLAVADTYSIDRSNGSGNAIVYFNVTSNDSFGPAGPNATHPLVLRNGITDTFSNGERRIRVDDNGTPNNLFDDRIAYYSTANPTFVTDSFIYTITDANGYASTATVTISLGVVSKTTGETNFFGTTTLKENTFLSYPNPSEGFVKTMLFSTINTTATILLFDITGKVIYNSETRITVGKNELDFNFNVKAGILFLKIISKEVDFGISKIVFK
jgi:hypothetical protein